MTTLEFLRKLFRGRGGGGERDTLDFEVLQRLSEESGITR